MSIIFRLNIQERIAVRKLTDAFEKARNRDSISFWDRQIIRPSEASELNAANPFARILLGRTLWSKFSDHFQLSESQLIPDVPLYWVSLADVGCMTRIDAGNVDVAGMIRKLRHGLDGLSYIGLMDLALYAHITPGTLYPHRTGVNWHLHLFAWGEDRRAMRARAKRMNELPGNYCPIFPQGEGFNWSQVTAENIWFRFPYMCKTPRSAYRVGRYTGEDEARFKSNKSELRDGQRITLFHLLKNHLLDDLMIAGGEGVAIRRRAIRWAERQTR